MTPTDYAIAEIVAIWLGVFVLGILIFRRWL